MKTESLIVYRLKSKNKVGYAVRKKTNQESIGAIREYSKGILPAYIESKQRKQTSEDYIVGKAWNESYAFTKEMCEILEEKYFSKEIETDTIVRLGISDLEYSTVTVWIKEDVVSIRKMLESFMGRGKKENIMWDPLYTEKMKEKILEPEDLNKEYYYLTVVYVDINDDYLPYNYISEDESVMPKDKVVVERSQEVTVALVIDAKKYNALNAPYPVKSTKRIIKKIENDDELDNYDLDASDFEDAYYEFFESNEDDDDNDEDYDLPEFLNNSYRRITTFSEDKNVIAKISVKLIEEKLAASTHTDKVVSSYWWNGKVVGTEEYRLEIITKVDKIDEIVKIIKEIHNYEVPEIQIDEHQTLNKDIESWIDENVK